MANTTSLILPSDGAGRALFAVPTLSGDQTYVLPVAGQTLGASDMFQALVNAEVAVGSATTATAAKMHVCSGTTANYALTLPAAATWTGKFIGIRISTAMTKLLTVTANGGETIDGAATRIMWAGESAILYSDGSNVFKVAGKSIPQVCHLQLGADTAAVTVNVATKVSCGTYDSTRSNYAAMGDTANGKIVIARPGMYSLYMSCVLGRGDTSASDVALVPMLSGANTETMYSNKTASNWEQVTVRLTPNLALNATVEMYVYYNTGSGLYVSSTGLGTFISAQEILTW